MNPEAEEDLTEAETKVGMRATDTLFFPGLIIERSQAQEMGCSTPWKNQAATWGATCRKAPQSTDLLLS